MSKAEVHALMARFKSSALLLMECNLFDGYEELLSIAQVAFDEHDYNTCKKALDLLDAGIVTKLEV